MIGHSEGFFRRVNGAACDAQAFKGLRAGDLMHEVAVDIKQRGSVLVGFHQVIVPNFVVNGFAHC